MMLKGNAQASHPSSMGPPSKGGGLFLAFGRPFPLQLQQHVRWRNALSVYERWAGMSRLVRSAGLIGLATMTSRVLGVARETALAALFGAGNDMDAFNVAFRIPNLLRDLFAEGAIS